jgi:hypothetical protein
VSITEVYVGLGILAVAVAGPRVVFLTSAEDELCVVEVEDVYVAETVLH